MRALAQIGVHILHITVSAYQKSLIIGSHPSPFYIKSLSSKCVIHYVPDYVGHFIKPLNQASHERYLATHQDPQLTEDLIV